MTTYDFKGPVTNDKTAVFLKGKGLPSGNNTALTASANLVATLDGDFDDENARWAAVKAWGSPAHAGIAVLCG